MSILSAIDVHVTFQKPNCAPAHAVRGASLSVSEGEIVGILGESGSGKSTLARVLAGASLKNARCRGRIQVLDQSWDCTAAAKTDLRPARVPGVGFVSQHPSLVLNPFQRVRTHLWELLAANRVGRSFRADRSLALLSAVCLKDPSRISASYPHQLSGGEKQRVAIAMALAGSPKVLVCDEATASVDSATAAGLLAIFASLRTSQGLAIVWITHDPSQLRRFAHRTAVMYAGRIVEVGLTSQILDASLHPYTTALMRCARRGLVVSSSTYRERLPSIPGEGPDASVTFAGCSFAERCSGRREACEQGCPPRAKFDAGTEVECVLYE